MPIPPFKDFILPPSKEPYRATPEEFASRFVVDASLGAFSERRLSLLRGFFRLRSLFRLLPVSGFQWIDGSFVEDVEAARGRPPGDIDLVTVITDTMGASQKELQEELLRIGLVLPRSKDFGFDSLVYITVADQRVNARNFAFYVSLFSHTTDNLEWKGFVELPLTSDLDEDRRATEFLGVP